MASTLSSSSSDADIQAAYLDNGSYEEDQSLAKARGFVTACRLLLFRLPKRSKSANGHEVEFDPAVIQAELQRARAWIAAKNRTGGGIVYRDFRGFRD